MASKLKSMARQKEEKLKHTANSYTPEFKTEVRDILLKLVLENQHIAELCQGIWPITMNSFSRKWIVPFSLMDRRFRYYWNPDICEWKILYSSCLKLHYG